MKSVFLSSGQKVSIQELKKLGNLFYKDLVVGAVDLRTEMVVFGGEFNNDARNELLEKKGSKMEDVWGFKILISNDSRIASSAAITDIRPAEGNNSQLTDEIRSVISDIIYSKIEQNVAV
jgi:hypothetical protein